MLNYFFILTQLVILKTVSQYSFPHSGSGSLSGLPQVEVEMEVVASGREV